MVEVPVLPKVPDQQHRIFLLWAKHHLLILNICVWRITTALDRTQYSVTKANKHE